MQKHGSRFVKRLYRLRTIPTFPLLGSKDTWIIVWMVAIMLNAQRLNPILCVWLLWLSQYQWQIYWSLLSKASCCGGMLTHNTVSLCNTINGCWMKWISNVLAISKEKTGYTAELHLSHILALAIGLDTCQNDRCWIEHKGHYWRGSLACHRTCMNSNYLYGMSSKSTYICKYFSHQERDQ